MKKPNVILITIDCLRYDRLGCYGYLSDISPNIDSLASRGALFAEAIANGGRTPDSFPSILASQLPPLSHLEYREVMKRSPALAMRMKEGGYRTAAFLSNPFLSKIFNYHIGFDVYNDDLGILSRRRKNIALKRPLQRIRILMKIKIYLGMMFDLLLLSLGKQRDVTAGKLTDCAISWCKSCQDNYFLWLHYMDAHYPYLPPSSYIRRLFKRRISRFRMIALYLKQLKRLRHAPYRKLEWLTPAEVKTLSDLYDANIKYIDDNIGRLVAALGGHLEDTLIIVTADHGEAFSEHNWLGHGMLYEELVRVPLIMFGPGIKAGTVVKQPVELMSLAPTIAELTGTDNVEGFFGKSMLPTMAGGDGVWGTIATNVIPELRQLLISYRTPEWKYIRTESLIEADAVLSEEVYHLKNDPREEHNLCGSGAEEVITFKSEAVNRVLEFKRLKRERGIAYERERIRARLKKLSRL